MPRYIPIAIDFQLVASRSDLVSFTWTPEGIAADFAIPDDPHHVLRVDFDKQCIVRLLDKMPLSTELDNKPDIGLVKDHLSYMVEGAAFADSQSEVWKLSLGPPCHWRFVTGWTCMDVLSAAAPRFKRVELGRPESA